MPKKPILVADPDPSLLMRVVMLLVVDGYAVRGASTSKEAIDRAQITGVFTLPRLLIINPQMPGLSGVQAASQISRDARCKVIFLTELAKDPDFRELLRGLRQQGCDCSAVNVRLPSAALGVHHQKRLRRPVEVTTEKPICRCATRRWRTTTGSLSHGSGCARALDTFEQPLHLHPRRPFRQSFMDIPAWAYDPFCDAEYTPSAHSA